MIEHGDAAHPAGVSGSFFLDAPTGGGITLQQALVFVAAVLTR